MLFLVMVLNQSGSLRYHQAYHSKLTKQLFSSIQAPILQKANAKGFTSNLIKLSEIVSAQILEEAGLHSSDLFVAFRKYQSIIITFMADQSESELALLDLIQVFVQTLFKALPGLMEADFSQNYLKIQKLVDQFIVDGMVSQTQSSEVLNALDL